VTGACRAVETDIAKAVAGRTFADLAELDRAIVELDGTANRPGSAPTRCWRSPRRSPARWPTRLASPCTST
jgi:hypothetical protein